MHSTRSLTGPRARILEMVQASASTSTVASLSQATGLHENTVRDHLKALVDAGHVEQVTLPPPPRGRPAQGYVASPSNPEPDTRVRDYAGLAVTLARHLQRNSSDPAREAEVAGDGWGRELAVNRSGAEDAAQYVLSLMTDLGFEPRLGPDGGRSASRSVPCLTPPVNSQMWSVVCTRASSMGRWPKQNYPQTLICTHSASRTPAC